MAACGVRDPPRSRAILSVPTGQRAAAASTPPAGRRLSATTSSKTTRDLGHPMVSTVAEGSGAPVARQRYSLTGSRGTTRRRAAASYVATRRPGSRAMSSSPTQLARAGVASGTRTQRVPYQTTSLSGMRRSTGTSRSLWTNRDGAVAFTAVGYHTPS